MVVIFPYSISKSFYVKALHILIFLLVILTIVVLLHLLLLLLSLHLSGLIVVHLVVPVIAFRPTRHRVLFVKLVQQLHENLVMVVESLCLYLLSPAIVMHLNVVQNSVH